MTPMPVEHDGPGPDTGLPIHDEGTLEETSHEEEGTLWTTPVPLPARALGRRHRRRLAALLLLAGGLGGLGGALVGAVATRPATAPVVRADPELAAWGDWLLVNPQAGAEVRRAYVDLLAHRGRPEAAFEEALAIVRLDPARPDRDALAQATRLALELAAGPDPHGLWAERAAAAADRFARYWPGDPLAPVLVEDVARTLQRRGASGQADALTRSHLCPE